MFSAVGKWLNTFTGALVMAIISFLCLWDDIVQGAEGWAWAMGVLTLYWLWVARRALKNKDIDDQIEELTEDQKARVKAATQNLADVLKEIDRELTMARREKARVQSDQRENQEAGTEGTDGRTDSKEDR